MRNFSDAVKAYLAGNSNITFCFDITLTTGEQLYLTNLQDPVMDRRITYLPYSALKIHKAHFNDGAKDSIELYGIFEDQGITPQHLITGARVIIFAGFQVGEPLVHLFTYYCASVKVYNLEFYLQLAPISTEFSKVFTERYSPTCRTEFGDQRCKVNKLDYSKIVAIQGIQDNNLLLNEHLPNDGYYHYGEIILQHNNYKFVAKIINQYQNQVVLDKAPPALFQGCREVTLIAGCDKEFLTCSKKFNNAINFRGEPFIREAKLYTLLAE